MRFAPSRRMNYSSSHSLTKKPTGLRKEARKPPSTASRFQSPTSSSRGTRGFDVSHGTTAAPQPSGRWSTSSSWAGNGCSRFLALDLANSVAQYWPGSTGRRLLVLPWGAQTQSWAESRRFAGSSNKCTSRPSEGSPAPSEGSGCVSRPQAADDQASGARSAFALQQRPVPAAERLRADAKDNHRSGRLTPFGDADATPSRTRRSPQARLTRGATARFSSALSDSDEVGSVGGRASCERVA